MNIHKQSRATKASGPRLSPSRMSNRSHLSELSSKCVSEICTCGMHRCPKVQDTPFNATTTNQEFYKPYKVSKHNDYTPEYRAPERHYDPSALQTTYNVEFVKKKPQAESRYDVLHRSLEYTPKKAAFNGETEYNSKYLRNKIRTEEPQEAIGYTAKKATKFQGETEYHHQFYKKRQPTNHLTDNCDPIRVPQKHLPFNGKSTYDSEFRPYQIKIENQQAPASYTPRKTKFQGHTQYDQVYRRYPNFNYSQEKCIVEDLPPRPNKLPVGHDHLRYSYRKNAWK